MENLSIDELRTIESWFVCMSREYSTCQADDLLVEKVRQAITDKEFEEKKLNF